VLRWSALAVLTSVVLFVVAPSAGVSIAVAILWGAAGALGIPTALQLAGAGGGDPARRIAVVTTCMYVAYLAGPPAIGLLGELVPVPVALLVLLPPLGAVILMSAHLRRDVASDRTSALIEEQP
jgi:hypothetical protein